jgi:hypothetical protein
MPALRDAVFWNLASAPARLTLGVAQTAVLARSLYGDAGHDLAAFALLSSGIATAVLITGFGTPQLFSRIVTDRIARRDFVKLGSFLATTAFLRSFVWTVLAVLFVGLVFELPQFLPDAVRGVVRNPWIVTLWLVWGWLFDISGLTGRLLSAAYEQKWQNAINVVSQALALPVIAAGIFFPDYSLMLALLGMCVVYGTRAVGHWMVTSISGATFTAASIVDGLAVWRLEIGQAFHATLDKFSSYLLSPHFVLLVSGYVLAADALASLFLVFELASKLIAVLAVPIAGLALPALAHAKVGGASQLQDVIRRSLALIRVIGVFVALLCGALAIPIAELLYGQPLRYEPAIVCAIVAITAVEFMMLEIISAYLIVERNVKRLWAAKTTVAACAVLGALAIGLFSRESITALAVFFVIRLLSIPYLLSVSGLPRVESARTWIVVAAVTVGTLTGHLFYQAATPWIWSSLGYAVAASIVFCVVAAVSVLRADVATVREMAHI